MTCPFCTLISLGKVLRDGGLALAVYDAFPVSPGHVLVLPRRHEPDFFSLGEDEQAAILKLVGELQSLLVSEQHPDGFNVGINVGAAAGQTVEHAHLHLIPRYKGDVADPRGGVRWIIPEKAEYWKR